MGFLPHSLPQRGSSLLSKNSIGDSGADAVTFTGEVKIYDWGLLGTEPVEVNRRKNIGIPPHPISLGAPLSGFLAKRRKFLLEIFFSFSVCACFVVLGFGPPWGPSWRIELKH